MRVREAECERGEKVCVRVWVLMCACVMWGVCARVYGMRLHVRVCSRSCRGSTVWVQTRGISSLHQNLSTASRVLRLMSIISGGGRRGK